ncbi:hypothetical protein AX774_g892 [Zancudomyces culisetae]|uniref:Uncharacterized protein n=1 Tax=Zancudomyces culisetae TaxID=1213189 RepID=A0A1R1PX83_ZANCU|nr:hypothetical protein AX774_g892 [Zancudomyces culisetae]|eukprot:OMH85554.1 hypothetical protein AX774_g892 [Zancudomyces culisetae]
MPMPIPPIFASVVPAVELRILISNTMVMKIPVIVTKTAVIPIIFHQNPLPIPPLLLVYPFPNNFETAVDVPIINNKVVTSPNVDARGAVTLSGSNLPPENL